MTSQIAPPFVRPRPASPNMALAGVLARLDDAGHRESLQRLAARADFYIAEAALHETEFGLEVQLSGEGRLLCELLD